MGLYLFRNGGVRNAKAQLAGPSTDPGGHPRRYVRTKLSFIASDVRRFDQYFFYQANPFVIHWISYLFGDYKPEVMVRIRKGVAYVTARR